MEVLQKVELLRSEVRDALVKLQVASVVPLPPELQIGPVMRGLNASLETFFPRALQLTSSILGSAIITEVVVVLSMEVGSLESFAVDRRHHHL